jgi:Ca2+-binding EF-hand superfamily protein
MSLIPQASSPGGGRNDGKKTGKTTKAGTMAERVVWMSRTSDVLGSHMKTDLESYLTLIRRKIQEKCATTADLITQIRRFKIGESGHVTPNEFRFTLIKFGIILPQALVDRIFNVFDSDRSGTMDFDEFAMWIMNSEFRPIVKTKKGKPGASFEESNSPRSVLRRKFLSCVKDYSRVFKAMKKQISFLEFVSDVNRTGMPLSDKEARSIFQILDPHDSGFLESELLTHWAETGRTKLDRSAYQKQFNALSDKELKAIIARAVGRNTRQLETAFAHIQHGSGTKLPFEEFRRCILNGGGSKNMQDVRDLFMALGGESTGLADIDYFFDVLPPIYKDPTTEVSVKPSAPPIISTSRADRHLRDAIRKCYKEVKGDIEREDPTNSGYIAGEKLYRILEHRCMPLTFQDFRFIVQQVTSFDLTVLSLFVLIFYLDSQGIWNRPY